MDIGARLRGLRDADLRRQRARLEEMERGRTAEQLRDDRWREEMMARMLPCGARAYSFWLAGWMRQGRDPQHFYAYNTPKLWMAQPGLVVRPLHGALAFNGVIIPNGVEVELTEPGHTTLFVVNLDGRYQGKPTFFAWGFHNRMETVIPCWLDTHVDGNYPTPELEG